MRMLGPIPSFTPPTSLSLSTCPGSYSPSKMDMYLGPECDSLSPKASPHFHRLGSSWQEPDSSEKGQKRKKRKWKERGLRGREAEDLAGPSKGREDRTERTTRKTQRKVLFRSCLPKAARR